MITRTCMIKTIILIVVQKDHVYNSAIQVQVVVPLIVGAVY